VDATREARIYAEAALSAEQKKLESGKSTSFVVLQLTKDLTAAGPPRSARWRITMMRWRSFRSMRGPPSNAGESLWK